MATWSTTQQTSMDPTFAEAWAALHAVTFSKDMGLFDIILEGNALQIIKEINSTNINLSRYGHFIDGIKTELSFFRSFRVMHERREANSDTHDIAREVVSHVVDSIRLEEIPPIIYSIVTRETIVPFL